MITQEHIETVLGAALNNLGYPVCNAALWKEELGYDASKLSEADIVKECERLSKEQKGIATTWESVRVKRNNLLKESDWVGLKDVKHPNEQSWLDYRQALRDIPTSFPTPEEVIWPNKPE